MAFRDVKNLLDVLYRQLRDRTRRQRRLISQEVVAETPLSILELKGLGKARWRGVDPAAHVARERRSWD